MGLFNDIELVRILKIVNLPSSLSATDFESELEAMCLKYISPFIGEALVAKFDTDYNTLKNYPTGVYGKAFKLFSRALYLFTAHQMIDKKKVSIQNMGIVVSTTENSKSASNQDVQNLKTNLLESAYDAVELLLEYLDNNVDTITEYKESSERKERLNLFIPSAKVFTEYYSIQKRFQTYIYLIPVIKQIEELIIETNISITYVNELKEKILSEDLTASDKQALTLIKKMIAYRSISDGCADNWVQFTNEGVFFTEYVGSVMEGSHKSTKAAAEMLFLKIEKAKENSDIYLNRLLDLLKSNPTNYPTFTTWYNEIHLAPDNLNPFKSEMRGCKDSGIFY